MAELLLTDVDEIVLHQLQERATRHGRTPAEEASIILAETVRGQCADAWKPVDENYIQLAASEKSFSDSADLVREDRTTSTPTPPGSREVCGSSIDRQRWVDAVMAFRLFTSRGKRLVLSQCVRIVHRDYTGRDPDPDAESEVIVIAEVVEHVLAQRGEMVGASFADVRQAWRKITLAEPSSKLVTIAARSVWRAEDERRLGGSYGATPSDGCKGIGIHRDEVNPWQENAIRAMEDAEANE